MQSIENRKYYKVFFLIFVMWIMYSIASFSQYIYISNHYQHGLIFLVGGIRRKKVWASRIPSKAAGEVQHGLLYEPRVTAFLFPLNLVVLPENKWLSTLPTFSSLMFFYHYTFPHWVLWREDSTTQRLESGDTQHRERLERRDTSVNQPTLLGFTKSSTNVTKSSTDVQYVNLKFRWPQNNVVNDLIIEYYKRFCKKSYITWIIGYVMIYILEFTWFIDKRDKWWGSHARVESIKL